MSKYDDIRYDKTNINDFKEGISNTEIKRSPSFHYTGTDREYNPNQLAISLACQSGTDVAHSVGNVTAILLQFIVDQFPSGTFATVVPATSLAHRQLKHTPKQVRTQEYPICVANPRISLIGREDRFGGNTFATTTWNNTSDRHNDRGEMLTLLYDKHRHIMWKGKMNRVVIECDFVLSFRTMIQRLNMASYLINKLPCDGSFIPDIETALELAIPDGFLAETSKYVGIPIKTDGEVTRFIDYLNMVSGAPISYKFASGRHKDGFYMYYPTNLLCRILNFNTDNGTRDNNLVESDFPITFTMRCEYNTIGLFDLAVPNGGKQWKVLEPEPSDIMMPVFSDVFNEKDFPLPYGWKIESRPIIQLDYGDKEVDLSPIFNQQLNSLIDYHLKNHLNIDLFIAIKMRENNTLINGGYYMDWEKRKLILTTVNYTKTYRFIMAVNRLYMKDLLDNMYNKKN